jgi:hypothetical protein
MTAWLALSGWLVAGSALGLAPGATGPSSPERRAPKAESPPSGDEATEASPAEGEVAAPPSPGDEATGSSPPGEGAPPPDAEPPVPGDEATGPSAPEGAPEGEAAEGEPEEIAPAPLPPKGPPPPEPSEPRARGGAYDTPLPQPPEDVDPSTIASGPWRGRVWLGIGLSASFPLAGRPPAMGSVISAVGEITVGWRLRPFLALHSSVSTFAHDAAQQIVTASDGVEVAEVAFGRITAFDLVTARFYVPLPRRIQPWAEVGAGVGLRRGPFDIQRQAVGLLRVGAGVDFWLSPTFTLGVSTAYRTIFLGDTVGHGLRTGADIGIHW